MRPPPIRIAALVVTHDRLERLRHALPCVLAEGFDRVLVVDNASNDGTSAWLAEQDDPRLAVLRLPENVGGAGGFEAGIAHLAATEDPDWILLQDDDAWPEPGAITRFRTLVPTLATDTGAVAAAVRQPDGKIADLNRPGYNPFWSPRRIPRTLLRGTRAGFKLPDAAYDAGAPVVDIDNASFVGFFVARHGWQRAGLPEGGLFIYGDDVLYSLRLRRAGMTIAFAPAVRFTHDSATMEDGFIYRPLWKIYYHARNGVAIARAAAGPLMFPFALVWYLVVWLRRGRHYDISERGIYRSLLWRGVRDGILHRRGRVDNLPGR